MLRLCKLAWRGFWNLVAGTLHAVCWPITIMTVVIATVMGTFLYAPDQTERAGIYLLDNPITGLSIVGTLLALLILGAVRLMSTTRARHVFARVSRANTYVVGACLGATAFVSLLSGGCWIAQQALHPTHELARGSYIVSNGLANAITLPASRAVANVLHDFDVRTGWPTRKINELAAKGNLNIDMDRLKVAAAGVKDLPLPMSSFLYDDKQEIGCYAVRYGLYRKLDETLKRAMLAQAFWASEDAGFEDHNGIDLAGLMRAALAKYFGGRVEYGGSTITMQAAKNALTIPLDKEDPEFSRAKRKSIVRKVADIFLALYIERSHTKDQIFEWYINSIDLGSVVGIEAAARSYFNKTAETTTLAEAAFIAGMTNYPNLLQSQKALHEPERSRRLAIALARKDRVLLLMFKQGRITQAAYERALKEKLEPQRFERACDQKEPFIRDQVREELGMKGDTALAHAGAKVYTTIKSDHQEALTGGCNYLLAQYLKRRPHNKDTIRCGAISVEIDNGHIVAMVSGQDHARHQYNMLTQSKLLCGSICKVFTYAALLEKLKNDELARRTQFCRETQDAEACRARWEAPLDLLGKCVVIDSRLGVPSIIGIRGRDENTYEVLVALFWPKNYPYKNRPQFRGKMECEDALAESRNLGAMSAMYQLSNSIDPLTHWRESEQVVVETMRRFGFTSELRNKNKTGRTEEDREKELSNFTLPLGSVNVTPKEIAEGITTIVNGGRAQPLTIIRKVTDRNGNPIPHYASSEAKNKSHLQVIDPEVALGARALLTQPVDNVLGTAHSLRRTFPTGALCGKTGTATGGDRTSPTVNWFAGCTRDHVVVFVLANDNNAALGPEETGGKNAVAGFAYYVEKMGLVQPDSKFKPIEIPKRPLPVVFPQAANDDMFTVKANGTR